MMQTWRPRPSWSGGSRGSSWRISLCQKTGEETRQEESRGDGGEKEGSSFLGKVKVFCYHFVTFLLFGILLSVLDEGSCESTCKINV